MYGLGIAQPATPKVPRFLSVSADLVDLVIYKDTIDLTSRWKVRLRRTFFLKMKYK